MEKNENNTNVSTKETSKVKKVANSALLFFGAFVLGAVAYKKKDSIVGCAKSGYNWVSGKMRSKANNEPENKNNDANTDEVMAQEESHITATIYSETTDQKPGSYKANVNGSYNNGSSYNNGGYNSYRNQNFKKAN